MKKNKRIFLFVLVPIIIFLIVIFIFFSKRKKTEVSKNLKVPTPELLPTIDSSVLIDLTPVNQRKGLILSIKNIPLKTKSIEYIITYETEDGGFQGVNSSVSVEGSSFKKEITLGTCSSGACVYHLVKGGIKLELVFKGDYGERFFNREYFF